MIKTPPKIAKLLLLTVLVMMVLPWAAGASSDPEISEIQSAMDSFWLRISFSVSGVFEGAPELQESLEAGDRIKFTYRIKVMQRRNNWVDKELEQVKAVREAKKDPVTGRFAMAFFVNGVEQETIELATWQEARDWLIYLPWVNVIPSQRIKNKDVYLKLRAHFFEDVKMLIPWDYETKWKKVETPKIDSEPSPPLTPEPAP